MRKALANVLKNKLFNVVLKRSDRRYYLAMLHIVIKALITTFQCDVYKVAIFFHCKAPDDVWVLV